MKQLFAEIFSWWNGQTWGVHFLTLTKGKLVGTDSAGNRYYQHKSNNRRWVIYNGVAEASAIEPGWHGWMHHRTDTPPTEENYTPREWQKPHRANLTGTPAAYRPEGSLLKSGERPRVNADYDAWSPE